MNPLKCGLVGLLITAGFAAAVYPQSPAKLDFQPHFAQPSPTTTLTLRGRVISGDRPSMAILEADGVLQLVGNGSKIANAKVVEIAPEGLLIELPSGERAILK
jgi:hypothetical protein